MDTITDDSTTEKNIDDSGTDSQEPTTSYYRIQFRPEEQIYSTDSNLPNIKKNEVVMVHTDHGLEPARVIGRGPALFSCAEPQGHQVSYSVVRRANREEAEKYEGLLKREEEAFAICSSFIDKHKLEMKLIKVERFFNGSKIIFYFTAENRVDFRELVKDLVQEFRTRVEIRQIGVRHETKMIGGVGCCGRELCCSSYIKKFAPVSIKMAKEQNLPLNPAKISGICNRLLCCLTYEYDTYHAIRKKMPKLGKTVTVEGHTYKVMQQDVLHETVLVADPDDPEKSLRLGPEEWARAKASSQAPEQNRQAPRKKNKEPRPPRDSDRKPEDSQEDEA